MMRRVHLPPVPPARSQRSTRSSGTFIHTTARTRCTGRSWGVKMPASLCGTWEIISNVNLDGYMTALGIGPCLRKIALKVKMRKVIEQQGDQYIIKTLSSFRNYNLAFRVGQEFEEFTKGLDGRHVKTLVTWEGNKLVCEQSGEKKNRGWTHWIEDNKLHLELYCEGEVCKQVFKKNVTE